MDKILIFGHRNPDTDSVTAAISLSYFKNKLGYNTVPRILGDLNNETKFVLDYFDIKKPSYLNDVKLHIGDLNYKKNFFIHKNSSIENGLSIMSENDISSIPVVDDNQKLIGMLALKNIAKYLVSGKTNYIHADFDSIVETLKATVVHKTTDTILGDTSLSLLYSKTFIETVQLNEKSILIVGDIYETIEHALNSKIQLLIITNNSETKKEHIDLAVKNNVSVIKSNYDAFEVASKIGLSNHLEQLVNKDVTVVYEDDHVNDFIRRTRNYKFSNYPIVNSKNKCLGTLKVADVNNRSPKKVILVDHNEIDQSVEGLEEAEILEIVDHHKIGTISTKFPILFRNMPVGSTNTIIYLLFKEHNIEIPKNIAGLMLAGILSDTLILKSPTISDYDILAVKELSKLINIDYIDFGTKMFKSAASLNELSNDNILFNDFKNFSINDINIGIGQVLVMNKDDIENRKKELLELIEKTADVNNYDMVALFATDVINNGSYIYFNNKAKDILENSFHVDLEQGSYLPDFISRKKQIIPAIMASIENN